MKTSRKPLFRTRSSGIERIPFHGQGMGSLKIEPVPMVIQLPVVGSKKSRGFIKWLLASRMPKVGYKPNPVADVVWTLVAVVIMAVLGILAMCLL